MRMLPFQSVPPGPLQGAFPGEVASIVAGVPQPAVLAGVVALVCLGFRLRPAEAVRSGVLVGVGFVGIYLVVGLATERLAAAAADLPGGVPTVVDMGWPTAAAIGFGLAEIGFWMIPIFAALNVALFAVGFTDTLDADIHNYWHFAFIAGIVRVRTGNWPYALAVGLVLGLFSLVAADWTRPAIEETFDMEGISVPHGFSAVMAAAAIPIDAVVRRTPLAAVGADPSALQDRLGALGEPVYLGAIVGLGLGLAANAGALGTADAWYAVLQLGVVFAAVMYILPEVAGILMEGLTPLSEAVRDRMTERFPDRDVAVGVDSAVLVGDPAVAAAGLAMVPVALAMMLVLPGNELLWGVDLATFPFFFAMMAPIADRDVVRMVAAGTVLLVPVHYVATWLAPAISAAGRRAGAPIPADAVVTTGLSGSPANGILALPAPAGLVVGLAIVVALRVALRRWPRRMYVLAGASERKAEAFLDRERGDEE